MTAIAVAPAQAAIIQSGDVAPVIPPDGNLAGQELVIGDAAIGSVEVNNAGAPTSLVSEGARIANQAGIAGNATVTGAGAEWRAGDTDLRIGHRGVGRLTISNGGRVESALADSVTKIGDLPGSEGVAVVTDAGSQWTTGEMEIGNAATSRGELIVSNGGSVTTGNPGDTDANAVIADNTGATGEVRVIGPNSSWTIADQLLAGFRGEASLTIENSGAVDARIGSVGHLAGSEGEIVVRQSGRLTVTDQFTVGNEGMGTLTIEDGGQVNSALNDAVTTIGERSVGIARVTGATSRWVTSDIEIGDTTGGVGSLTVERGATVTTGLQRPTADALLGDNLPGRGSVLVTDAGSTWSIADQILLGFRGEADLTMRNGGLVTASRLSIGIETSGVGTLAFGIGDDGAGNTAAGLLDIAGLFEIGDGAAIFDLFVDDALALSLGETFVLMDYGTRSGDLFAYLDAGGVAQTLLDDSVFITNSGVSFLIDYDFDRGNGDLAFAATVTGFDASPAQVPEPPALLLLGAALGLFGMTRRREIRRRV